MLDLSSYYNKLVKENPAQSSKYPLLNYMPNIIEKEKWDALAKGLVQRQTALEAFIDDVYHDKQVVKDGIFPQRMIDESPNYFPLFEGFNPPNGVWNQFIAADVIKTGDKFLVVEENTIAPGALSRIILYRRELLKFLQTFDADLYEQVADKLNDVDSIPQMFKDLLKGICVGGSEELAIFTPGIGYATYYDHEEIRDLTGITLSTKAGFRLLEDGLYHKISSEETGVKYGAIQRRTFVEDLDDKYFPDGLGFGLYGIYDHVRKGNVGMLNTPGGGITGEKGVYQYIPKFIKYYLDEEPLLESINSYELTTQENIEFVLDNIETLVTKPFEGRGGIGVMIGADASPEQIAKRKEQILANPLEWVAQDTIEFEKSDTFLDGTIEQKYADLRIYLFTPEKGKAYVPTGAITRFSQNSKDKVVNLSHGGGVKDTWII